MTPDNSISNTESQNLAKRLRNEDPEQFQTLVRMHLSFVLDLQSEETDGPQEKSKQKPLKWGFVPFSKKIRGPDKGLVEGVPLTNDMISQIFQLVDFLSQEENIAQEGIFRRSGKMTRQQELKNLVTQGVKLNLDDGSYSVHDVATVLKGFLAELPEPLLTEAYYPAYCQIADLCHDNCSKSRVTKSLQLLLLLLPHENRRILRRILLLLHDTANHVETNRMSAENLATLFTPHLLCPRKLSPEVFHTTAQNLSCIVVYMIKEGLSVFEVPEALATDIKAYWDRRIRTPNMLLESSITEAKTVFSFVDRQKSEQEKNPTETALAQLYAHIQSLPESNKKKKLIKQFNKENGNGTPRTKSLGINIKKHIFSKNLSGKSKGFSEYAQFKNDFGVMDECNSPDKKRQARTPKLKLLSCTEDIRNKRSPSEDIKTPIDSPKTPKGSDDNAKKSKTSDGVFGDESSDEQCLGNKRFVMGRERNGKEKGESRYDKIRRGRVITDISFSRLPIQQECSNSESSGSKFFIEDRRLRPVIINRKYPVRRSRKYSIGVANKQHGKEKPTILDNEFWLPPQKGKIR